MCETIQTILPLFILTLTLHELKYLLELDCALIR